MFTGLSYHGSRIDNPSAAGITRKPYNLGTVFAVFVIME